MNKIFIMGFTNELEKIAASIKDLQKGFRRLGVIRTRVKNPLKIHEGMVQAAAKGKPVRVGPREAVVMGGGVSTHPNKRRN